MVGMLKTNKRELVSFFTILFHLYDEYNILYVIFFWQTYESVSLSVMSDSLQPHRL